MPPQIVDRDKVLFDFELALENGPGAEGRFMRVTGERGMGKTVILKKMADLAKGRGWNAIVTEANEGCVDYIKDKLLSFIGTPLQGGSINLRIGRLDFADPAYKAITLRRLLEIYFERSESPLFLGVDEVQDAFTTELREIVQSARARLGDGDEVAITVAGLPDMMSQARQAKGLTFLHRAMAQDIGLLDMGRVRGSYRQTFESGGITMDLSVLDQLATATGGHPYLMQLLGRRLWDHCKAADARSINSDDVAFALDESMKVFKDAVVDVMMQEISPSERAYLQALKSLGGTASSHDVAVAMGYQDDKKSNATSKTSKFRTALIKKGLVSSPSRGIVKISEQMLAD